MDQISNTRVKNMKATDYAKLPAGTVLHAAHEEFNEIPTTASGITLVVHAISGSYAEAFTLAAE